MELYNNLIKETKVLLDGSAPTVWSYRPGDEWKDIGNSELVLQKDAAYELGAAGRGSANYVLFTSSPELVDKDQVLLIYCRRGNRSKEASQKLGEMGYKNVYEFGGIETWEGEVVK